MSWQPPSEKNAERELIKSYAFKKQAKIIKLQADEDDGKTDGIIEKNGKKYNIEARRKGYKNHHGDTCDMPEGWDTSFLSSGIILNESVVKNHKETGFVFVVDIKKFKPRAALICKKRIEYLLKQPSHIDTSTNSKNKQVTKRIPLNWFKEY